MEVIVYTDGSSRGNPGPGGYGVVLLSSKGHKKELSQGYKLTTNNRMELLSVIIALNAIKPGCDRIIVFSDSKYVVDAINKKWVYNWERKGFAKKKNPDLWRQYLEAEKKHSSILYEWVKGHDGNKYNERCDQLAVKAATGKNLLTDTGYEASMKEGDLFN